jgi:excisionase family DNA binding protein
MTEDLADLIAERILARLNPLPDDRPLLTIPQVAERLGISDRHARKLVYEGDPPAIRSLLIGGARRIEPAALDEYLSTQRS